MTCEPTKTFKEMAMAELSALPKTLDLTQLRADAMHIARRMSDANEITVSDEDAYNVLETEFFVLLKEFKDLIEQVIEGEPPRNSIQLLAWVRQAIKAVDIKYQPEFLLEDSKQSEVNKKLFDLFVANLVLFVVIFDDISETTTGKGFDKLLPAVGEVVRTKLKSDQDLRNQPNNNDMSKINLANVHHREYVAMTRNAFDLHFSIMRKLGSTGEEDDTLYEQQAEIFSSMNHALGELFEMIDFSSGVDEKVRDSKNHIVGTMVSKENDADKTIKLPTVEEWMQGNQPSTQMKHMLLANFLQQWSSMTPAQRFKLNFSKLLPELNALGDDIDYLGTISNDFATVFREITQMNSANSIFIEALNSGEVENSDIQAAFAQVEQLPVQNIKQLMRQVAKAVFDGKFDSIPKENWINEIEDGVEIDAIVELNDKLFRKESAFFRILQRWRDKLRESKEKYKDSELAKLIDIDHLFDEQVNFLLKYIAINEGI